MYRIALKSLYKESVIRSAVRSASLLNSPQYARVLPQMSVLAVPNVRQFGFYSDFKKNLQEEIQKAKSETESNPEAASSETSSEHVEETTSNPESNTNSSEKKAEDAEKKAKDAEKKAKDAEKKAKDAEEKKKKMKEMKEKEKEMKKKASSFWNEFSSQMKKEVGIDTTKKPAKETVATKKKEEKLNKKGKIAEMKEKMSQMKEQVVEKKEKIVEKKEKVVEKEEKVNGKEEKVNEKSKEYEDIESLEELEEEEAIKEAKQKIKAERFSKSKEELKNYLAHKKGNMKNVFTVEYMKKWFSDAWIELKTGKKIKKRVVIDPEEVERLRREQKERQEEADRLKEEALKNGTPLRTDLVVSEGNENIWAKINAVLENAPIIDSIREASKKVRDSKIGETISYASEDMREKWETSQHPLVYKAATVYDEIFSETDIVKAVKQVQRTDPSFTEYELRDELQRETIPKLMEAFMKGDKKVLKNVLSEHAWAQCNQVIDYKEQNNLIEDPTILAIKQLEFVGAQVKERENPYFLYQCSVHQIYCVRNKEGTIVEGKPDEVKNTYYMFALHQELNEESFQMEWKVAELQKIAQLDTW
ncbi:hypothetical protein WA158_003738 [Blastocystis sp. Blastoise]